MGIREVLQTEIWSKETSRKILARIWKIAKYAGFSIGVVFAAIALFVFVWMHWLTAKERSAGKIALAQVEVLQNFDSASDAEFDAQAKQAKEKVDFANAVIFTGKDYQVATYLWLYLDQLKDMRLSKEMQEKLDSRPGYARSERSKELDLQIEASRREEIKTLRESLHESLDK